VCVRLLKALYGTVEAAKLWYDLITKILVEDGFVANPYDRCVLNKTLPDGTTLTVALYVDDLLVTCEHAATIVKLKDYLITKFPEVSFHAGTTIDYVGMTLDLESQPGAVVMTMKQMTDDIVNTSEVAVCKGITPALSELFTVEESPRNTPAEESWYRTYVAKLLYLAKRARPDVLLPVAFLTTRAKNSTHADTVKLRRVISYVAGTADRGIVIEFGVNPCARAYIDAAYASHDVDMRSHTGGSLVFGKGGPLYSTSVKQSIVTRSSTEAELVAFSDVASELICLRSFSIAQGYPASPAIVYQDNNSAMALVVKGGPCSKRSRHIDIRYFWISEKVAEGVIKVERCPTEIMWANLLTKPLQGAQFVAERAGLTNWVQ
jgi:hypothetical protein